ncbi:MAG: hypothetical protein OXF74_12085 [Rhodobacteraceae bacterium]|nr:hypothetical protein [Paracoccaceae bacterium]
MKLLAIEMSRVTVLFRATRPKGQAYLPLLAAKVAERYNFSSAPQTLADIKSPKVEFCHGLFKDCAVERFEVYNDGIIVTSCSDTDFIDAFIGDLVSWLKNEHGHAIIETHTVRRMYDSSLLVETDQDVFHPFELYTEILQLIEKSLEGSSGLNVNFQNFGFTFAADHTQISAMKPGHFRLERKEGIEFSRNQFYSTAPLRTKQHLDILERLEQLVQARL